MIAGVYAEQAALFRAGLLLGLVRGEEVVGWADQILGGDAAAPPAFVEIATTSPDDLTRLRDQLLDVCGTGESEVVVRRLLGLVQRDLATGRRGFRDTMTVLKQLRAFVTVTRDMNEQVKALGVDVAMASPGTADAAAAERRVRVWLRQYA
jgi:hypothetical protein